MREFRTELCLGFNLLPVLSRWRGWSFLSCGFVRRSCSFPPYRDLCLPELPCSPDQTGDPGDPYQRAPAPGVQRLRLCRYRSQSSNGSHLNFGL